MIKRVFIIHGWEDSPRNGWFPWLKRELEAYGLEVHTPAMPEPERPQIDVWVPFLKHLVGQANAHTYFIGHSIGCQTILRYFETLPAGTKVGGAILVAGWLKLKTTALEDEVAAAIAAPWLERPINWPKVRAGVDQVTAIMSDDDPLVDVEEGKTFIHELGAQLIVEHHQRHLSGDDGVMTLASALRSAREMMLLTT